MSTGSLHLTSAFGVAAPPAAAPSVTRISAHASPNVSETLNAKGNHEVRGLRIFKMGTFTDSFGSQHTWEDIHLEQMVMHYNLLKDGGYFPNVPWRADHSFSVERVIGYFTDLFRDPDDPTFLACAFEFTEPEAYEKYRRGTYRSRSLEVGMYETNDGSAFWPVVMGCAFVDIPAVEGLHGKTSSVASFSQVLTDDKESPSMDLLTSDPEAWVRAVNYAAWVEAATYAQACDDWSRAVTYAAALESQFGNPGAGQPPATPPATPPAPPAAPTVNFRVNGADTSDFARVQAHIDGLEQFRRETIETGRKDFVTSLATGNKIAATQVDSMHGLVLTMTDEQFAAFRATYEAAPAAPLFSQHGQQPGNSNTPSTPGGAPNDGQPSTEPTEIETLEEIVANHRRAGMSEEKVAKTASYVKLQQLKSASGQPA